jgi:hypothetical protein
VAKKGDTDRLRVLDTGDLDGDTDDPTDRLRVLDTGDLDGDTDDPTDRLGDPDTGDLDDDTDAVEDSDTGELEDDTDRLIDLDTGDLEDDTDAVEDSDTGDLDDDTDRLSDLDTGDLDGESERLGVIELEVPVHVTLTFTDTVVAGGLDPAVNTPERNTTGYTPLKTPAGVFTVKLVVDELPVATVLRNPYLLGNCVDSLDPN